MNFFVPCPYIPFIYTSSLQINPKERPSMMYVELFGEEYDKSYEASGTVLLGGQCQCILYAMFGSLEGEESKGE